jgi:hypothetical protein
MNDISKNMAEHMDKIINRITTPNLKEDDMEDQNQTPETQAEQPQPKPAKPFASLAQMERCKRLVAEGIVSQESYDASLAVTDVENLPERLHPKKS